MKYNSIGEQLIAKAQELDPNYKPDKFNDMSEAIDVILNNSGGGYKIKKLTITENGLYDNEFEAYKPVVVNVPQISENGVLLSNFLDAKGSADYLFYKYKGISVDDLIEYTYTSNVTSAYNMFNSCTNLTSIPMLDTSKVTNMDSMFMGCAKLTSIPALDITNVNNMSQMFSGCKKLTSVPSLDVANVRDFSYMFYDCISLTSIGIYNFKYSIDIKSTALGHDAIVAFLNQAGTANSSNDTITMGSTKLALLSDGEKAIATNKGWRLA